MNYLKKPRMHLLIVIVLLTSMVGIAKADFTFGTPTNLGSIVNSSAPERNMCFSADGLELYFDSARPGTSGTEDLWVSRRGSIEEDWGVPLNLGPTVNSREASWDWIPCLSPDDLELYFASDRTGGLGGMDIWVTTRPDRNANWSIPENLGPVVNSAVSEAPSFITADGLSMYFFSYQRSGGFGADDLWLTQRATVDDPWDTPINLGPLINSPMEDAFPTLSPDSLVLIFSSGLFPYNLPRPGGLGASDLWWTRRESLTSPWPAPLNLGSQINTSYHENSPKISLDGSTLYFCSNRPGSFGDLDIWQTPILPIVDFNGNGLVDTRDILRLIESWEKDNVSIDIAPLPFGDGIVDSLDLELLMRYWGQPVDDPTLVAHWPLDEAEDALAYDSAGVNDAILIGDTAWQPDDGQIDGALQLDGVSGCAITGPVLNPADGPFSVFVWIKGGAPGQVVISQQNGANWLETDPDLGGLITELIPPAVGRFTPQPLRSEYAITDGQWHRIGFVWDGSHRTLYVDGFMVAEDTQSTLESSNNGLYIGCGKGMESGSYFSGLIDDARIYNRIITP